MAFKNLFNKSSKDISSKENSLIQNDERRNDITRPSTKAIIYRSELDYISRCILDYTNNETGGQLFGFWTANGTPIVAYAIGPGRNAKHNATSFIQDQDYLQKVGYELYHRYRLLHIGEWHSHHQLNLSHPSGGDVETMQYGVGQPGFPRLLLCIGNCTPIETTLNAFNFHENYPREYVHASWDIIKTNSPYRDVVDKNLHDVLIHPLTVHPSHHQSSTANNGNVKNEKAKSHWLVEDLSNIELMKDFLSIVKTQFPNCTVRTEITDDGEPQIYILDIGIKIFFPYGFPIKSPVLIDKTGHVMEHISKDESWNNDSLNLSSKFEAWVNCNLKECSSFLGKEKDSISDLNDFEENPLQPEDLTKEYHQAKRRTERLCQDNQILSDNFHPNAFLWSSITDEPIVNIVAFPFSKRKQAVIRMIIPGDFPLKAPIVQYGFYIEDTSSIPTLPEHLEKIQNKPISELFSNADQIYSDLLDWSERTSLYKAYIVACILLYYFLKSEQECNDIMIYLTPLLNDKNTLNKFIKKFSDKIIENKQI